MQGYIVLSRAIIGLFRDVCGYYCYVELRRGV